MEARLSSDEITKDWLLENDFRQDGDKEENEEYGRKVAGEGITNVNDDHCQILVSLKDRGIYLEEYDEYGDPTQIVKIPGFSRTKVRRLLELFDRH